MAHKSHITAHVLPAPCHISKWHPKCCMSPWSIIIGLYQRQCHNHRSQLSLPGREKSISLLYLRQWHHPTHGTSIKNTKETDSQKKKKKTCRGMHKMQCNVEIYTADDDINIQRMNPPIRIRYASASGYWTSIKPKMLIEKSRTCHNHKPQPTSNTKRKRRRTKINACKINKQMHEVQLKSLISIAINRDWVNN